MPWRNQYHQTVCQLAPVNCQCIDLRTLHTALADISAIRAQIARASEFRGYGPRSMAATGLLAFLTAAFQSHWLKGASQDWQTFLLIWLVSAALCMALTTFEMVARTRAIHASVAGPMIEHAAEQIAPTLITGLLLTFVIDRFAPNTLWLIPGLWQILFSLGFFASRRTLPWPIFAVGGWYLTTGLVCIALASDQGTTSPWAMGVPFGFGQLFFAAVLLYRESFSD